MHVIYSHLIAVVFAVCASYAHAQEPAKFREQDPQDVVRITTTLVTVPVSVKDLRGKSISDLRREDFRLYEDGVEQTIVYFEPPDAANTSTESTETSLTIALLLDVSDSTQFKLQQIQAAANAFINQLGAGDRMLVIAFDKRVNVLTEATNDRSKLRAAIERTVTGGGTSLYDAIDITLNDHLSRISGRKAIVLLTDGVDTSSARGTYLGTVRDAHQLDAAIYPVQYHTYTDFADNPSRETSVTGEFGSVAHVTKSGEPASEAYKRATLYLKLLAERTGGRFEYTDKVKNLSKSFARIASELREQYTLGYYPKSRTTTKGESLRQIRVDVAKPQVKIDSRRSYLYKDSPRPTKQRQ
ncbi:MAG TPA: VWA domain-containing protein [Pyrinomonadaceae bacterium]|nr:VWA domain-containing protein [Pyrinomonadaceae bacterium]